MRVLPDVVGIDRAFDYVVPTSWEADGRAERVVVGSMVRIPLAGRRVDGWVTAVEVEPESGVRLVELVKLRGMGPSPELLDLAGWAAWRWAGRRVAFLRSASPERMVAAAAKRRPRDPVPAGPRDVFGLKNVKKRFKNKLFFRVIVKGALLKNPIFRRMCS